MLHRPFWTERRLTGMTFLVGALLFFVGDAPPGSSAKGTMIWLLPLRDSLLVVWAHALR